MINKIGLLRGTDCKSAPAGYSDEGYIVGLKSGHVSRAVTQFKGKIFASGPSNVFFSHGYLNANEMTTPYIFKISTLGHEFVHYFQNKNTLYLSHAERELSAYSFTIEYYKSHNCVVPAVYIDNFNQFKIDAILNYNPGFYDNRIGFWMKGY